MRRAFAITFDYLCPFARIVNETVVEALEEGAPWEVRFLPFSLAQAHVEEGGTAAWDRPSGTAGTRGVRALQWGVAVRDSFPEGFRRFHVALYSARHDEARDVDDPEVLAQAATAAGLDPAAVADAVASGTPREVLAREHTEAVDRWAVFGVPTLVAGDETVFVRLMRRHDRSGLERVLDLLGWTDLNEFKRTRIPR
jgi:2-hydroxychromene-2-carboxylate isomerase